MSIVSGIINAVTGSEASDKATDAQAKAEREKIALQREMFDYQKEIMKPWYMAGSEFALPKLKEMIEGGPPRYTIEEFMSEPYVKQSLEEAREAAESSASARGMLQSGKALKDISRGTASFITSAFPQRERQKLDMWLSGLTPLQSMAGLGQTATSQLGGFASQFGHTAGESLSRMGEARASGYINRANAISGGVNQAMAPLSMLGMMWGGSKFGLWD